MSKYNNVNPGQYKVAGRERPDTMAKARLKESQKKQVKASAPAPRRKPRATRAK